MSYTLSTIYNIQSAFAETFHADINTQAVSNPAADCWEIHRKDFALQLIRGSIASSAPFLVFLIFQHWLGRRQRAGRAPGLGGVSSELAWVRMHAEDWDNKSSWFKIPVYCGRSCAVCCVGVLLDKTDIPVQNQRPWFAYRPLHRNQFTSRFSFTLCLFFFFFLTLQPSEAGLWTYYGCTMRIRSLKLIGSAKASTKGILILWNEEVKQSGGSGTDRKSFFDRIF